jgi:hypothetical protein
VNRTELEPRLRQLYHNNKKSIMKLSHTKNKNGRTVTQVDFALDINMLLLSVNVRPSYVTYIEDKSYLMFNVLHDPKLTEGELDALFEKALSELE